MAKKSKMPVEAELITTPEGEKDYSGLSPHEQAANQCKDRIIRAMRGYNTALYDIALGLAEAYDKDYAPVFGYSNFAEFVETELDMKYRSAYYMVEIAHVVTKIGIAPEQVNRIGWSKMKSIASYIQEKPEEADKYLEMAETLSSAKLQEALKSEVKFTEGKDASGHTLRLSMKLDGDAASIVNDALALAYGDIGREDTALAIQHITSEWMVARGSTPSGASLEDWIKYLEKAYGVKLVRTADEETLDALLSGTPTDTAADDKALEELLAATEEDLANMTQ
jgi:hypothetical protein